jgi:hypothetical protein
LDKKIANGGRFLGRKIGISLVIFDILEKVFEAYWIENMNIKNETIAPKVQTIAIQILKWIMCASIE